MDRKPITAAFFDGKEVVFGMMWTGDALFAFFRPFFSCSWTTDALFT